MLRGLEKVETEIGLIAMAHNLKKVSFSDIRSLIHIFNRHQELDYTTNSEKYKKNSKHKGRLISF